VIFRSESSRDRPSGNRPLPGIIEEARQTLTDDLFGIRHDAITPAHQVDLLTGIGPRGARMPESLIKPVLVSVSILELLRV